MLPSPFDRVSPGNLIISHYQTGDLVFSENHRVTGLGFVESGAVELSLTDIAGRRLVIHRAEAGETLMEACLFSKTYECDCHATEDSNLIIIRKSAVMALMRSDPDFALQFSARLATQVQDTCCRLQLLSIKSAEERVLSGLSLVGQKSSVVSFADEIGLTPEATFRALTNLVNRGAVARTGRGQYAVTAHQG